MEGQRELLPHFPTFVGDNVLRVGVDPPIPVTSTRKPVSSNTSRRTASVTDSPTSWAPRSSAQRPLSVRSIIRTSPALFRTIAVTAGTMLFAAGAAGSS